jgi:23S rRNA pseudouridine955/2504/2580 synthase
MPTLRVDRDGAGQRLDRYLRKILPGMPPGHLFKMLRTRKIRVNGKRARAEQVVAEGDEVLLHMEETRFAADTQRRSRAPLDPATGQPRRRSDRIDFSVLFEDEYLLVVSKPAGLPVHPGAGHLDNSLIDQVHAYLEVPDAPASFRPSLVHRLDRDTSGVVLIGKTAEAVRKLSRMFMEGQVDKRYLALARGAFHPPEGLWQLKVERRDVPGARQGRVPSRGRPDAEGKTAYRVLVTRKLPLPDNKTLEVSLLQLKLLTGKTHQIRSHLLQVGHPLAGDVRYGDPEFNKLLKARFKLKRQFLHAFRVELVHPMTGKHQRWTDPYPADLERIVQELHLGIPS